MQENILKVKVDGGNEVEIEVLDIIEIPENEKKYMVYSMANSENEDVFISILNETETDFSLDTIEDDNEFRAVEEFIINMNSNSEEGE